MRMCRAPFFLCLSSLACALNIVISNDDGWAEINIRALRDIVSSKGHSALVSAPALNRSGTGSSDAPPTPLIGPCEFNSCPAGSPATGHNASDPRLNYVNSFPATSMRYGIETLSPKFFGGKRPDIALAGFNVGSNDGFTVFISGTVGAAVLASSSGVPAIAYSGVTGQQIAWNAPEPHYVGVYAALSEKLLATLISGGPRPYLPPQTWLNVNFQAVGGSCVVAKDFKFVLTRILPAVPLISGEDVETCNNNRRLPQESDVLDSGGCYATVSLGRANDKRDADAAMQAVVLRKLKSILTCYTAS